MTDTKKLKVTILEPVGGHGGMNYYDLGLCNGLGHAGIDVTLYTCDENPPISVSGIFIVKPVFRGIYGSAPVWQRGLSYVWTLVTTLVYERVKGSKLVHFHFFYVGLLEFLGVLLARCLTFRVVVTAHDVESFDENLSVQSLVKLTYATVSYTHLNRSSCRNSSRPN